MANELKELVVKGLVSNYRNTNNYLVVNYQGIKALEFDRLRKDLRKKKICLEIVKNSLAAIAFKELKVTEIIDMLRGPSAVITGGEDPVIMAKETLEWSKKIPFLSLRGGFVEGATVSVDDINNLAMLPSMPVLRTQVITGINAPIVGVASAFNAVLRSLVTVFQAVKDKKEKSGE
ncbi:MAG: 50S ribosomal protein L10 [Candidatus Brocadia sp.]|nr:50S ribosomal protein L10 [Candidatus Brocadia sp.]